MAAMIAASTNAQSVPSPTAAATQRVLDQLDGPVILVGNSYGGSIITVAGSDPR
jgi:pimeloyl-ACP methyl ester carboxylesterase